MDQIQAMRIFVRVVEAGTFTRAADSLSLPKATVTKHVQALEARLRVKLLNRTTRRVTVTPDGAAYYDRTVRLLTDLDDIEASMTNARANPRGRLRIEVLDTGPGITEPERRLIFDEFRRGEDAAGQGLGLGLSIADRIAALLEAPLGLRSRSGQGSAFTVELARIAAPAIEKVLV